MHRYIFKGKEATTKTKKTKTKAVIINKAMKSFIVTYPRLTRLIMSIGIFAMVVGLFMISASPEGAFAWQPVSNHTVID